MKTSRLKIVFTARCNCTNVTDFRTLHASVTPGAYIPRARAGVALRLVPVTPPP